MDLRIVCPDRPVRRLATRWSISGEAGQRILRGVMLDPTKRHATEQRLRQAHERAALAARAVPMPAPGNPTPRHCTASGK